MSYRVTGLFGVADEDDIIECYPVCQDEDQGIYLVYHPKERDLCGSFEFCRLDKDGHLVATVAEYCNVGKVCVGWRDFLGVIDELTTTND